MIDNIKTNLKTLHSKNLSLNGTNLSVNSQNSSLNDKNLSLIRHVTAMVTKLEETIKSRLLLDVEKKGCNRGVYPFLTVFLASKNIVKQVFTTDHNKRYHVCTTKHSAANPSRHSLDIFVPKTYLVNTQQVTTGMNKLVLRFKRYTYATGHSDVSCDGMSEPNKIPLWGNKFRGLNAVVVIPFYPFFTIYNKHTKHSGGHYHA